MGVVLLEGPGEANASRGSVYFYNSYFVQPEEVNTGLQGFVFLLDN